MNKTIKVVTSLSEKEVERELDKIDKELDKLVDNASFYRNTIEKLISRRTKLDDVLLSREAAEIG